MLCANDAGCLDKYVSPFLKWKYRYYVYCLKPEGTNKNNLRSTVSCAYKKFFKIKNSNKKDPYDQNNALLWAHI